jgi:phosphoribosylformimino-5-aminoimidazole carboxamide ribotide isomerase
MKIIPAIDLKDGKCVRLLKGDFDATTEYSSNPAEIGRRFSALDVEDLHIVDLDGARTGTQQNHAIVADIARETGLRVQLGGGCAAATTWRRGSTMASPAACSAVSPFVTRER